MTYPDINPEKIKTIIREASEKYIIPRFQSLKDHEIDTKTGPEDLVTAADIETEIALTDIFKKEFPGCEVMGEEAVSRGDMSIKSVFENEPKMLWVIDPVDGTWNFAHGSPVFACMVALRYKGDTVMSWIYNVMQDKFAFAEKGQGATYAGKILNINRPAKPLEEIHGYLSHIFAPKDVKAVWAHKAQHIATAGALRCAAHSYMRLARGLIDFHITTKEKPWDHLAGDLLIREAGGIVKTWDGEPYHPTHYREGLLSTFSQDQWDILYDHFIKDVIDMRGL